MTRRRAAAAAGVAAFGVMVLAAAGCGHLVLLHDPLTAAEHNDLGVVYETKGEPALAAREYRRSLKLAPRRNPARVNLGNALAAQGRWGAASRQFRRATRDSAGDGDAHNNLAAALLRLGRPDRARASALRAVAAGGPRATLYAATLAEADSALAVTPRRTRRR